MAATVATRQKKAQAKWDPKKKLQCTRPCDPSLPALPMDAVIVAGESDSDLGSQSDADPPPPTTAQRRTDRDERVVERAVQRDISRINRLGSRCVRAEIHHGTDPFRHGTVPFRPGGAKPGAFLKAVRCATCNLARRLGPLPPGAPIGPHPD